MLYVRLRAAGLAALILLCAGCRLGVPPDPNDPSRAGQLTPDVIKNNLRGASDALLDRVAKGQIDDAKYKELLANAANSLLDRVDIGQIPKNKAWEYGEIYITARRWKDAKRALEIAVKAAPDEDRRVNDNLRLARVLSEMGDVKSAIPIARSTFNASDTAAAPILPATLLEIVKAGEGKGQDAELAALLEEAIKCEERTIIDAATVPGQTFLIARPYHIRKAWAKVITLYKASGKAEEAKAATVRAQADMKQEQHA